MCSNGPGATNVCYYIRTCNHKKYVIDLSVSSSLDAMVSTPLFKNFGFGGQWL
jgi:hypothetical protein